MSPCCKPPKTAPLASAGGAFCIARNFNGSVRRFGEPETVNANGTSCRKLPYGILKTSMFSVFLGKPPSLTWKGSEVRSL